MKVRTLRDHANNHGRVAGIPYEKTSGRLYEIEDEGEAEALIAAGLVENASKKSDSK
jgi:hypothetical protein